MTRKFGSYVHCPFCGNIHTAENAFDRWLRNHPGLDSKNIGLMVMDCDLLLHRYKFSLDLRGEREIQAIMFIDVKAHGAKMDVFQQDTLSMFNQVLRNRNRTPTAERRGRHADDHAPPAKTWSHVGKRKTRLFLLGGHLLRMSGESPPKSEWMTWDNNEDDTRRRISVETLISLLKFDLDPDTLKPMDWRRHHRAPRGQRRFNFDE